MCGMHILHIHVYQCGGTHGCIYKLFYFFPVPVIITMTQCNLGGKRFILAYTSRVQSIRRKVRTGTKTEAMEEHWVTHKLVVSYHSYTAQAHLPKGLYHTQWATDMVTG